MTQDEIDRIAEKIMGWTQSGAGRYWATPDGKVAARRHASAIAVCGTRWDPSADDAACCQLLDRLAELFAEVVLAKYHGGWRARVRQGPGQKPIASEPMSFPSRREAVCQAALMAAEVLP